MNICLLNDSFPPVIDGVVNVLQNYARYLMQDHQTAVMVGTPRYPGADYTQYPYPVVAYRSIDTAAMTNGYRAGNPFDEKSLSEMAAFRPDIIHSHCPASATVMARLLREASGAPVIFTYHTKYDIDIERFLKIRPIAQESIRAMVSNIEACDDIWVVSRGAGESLKALGFEGEYRVVNNGVDFAKGRVDQETVRQVTAGYDLPEDVPVFLFVGRMMTYKGIPLILEALKKLDDAGEAFRMVLIGKGPDQEMLEKQAESLGIREKCYFTGPIYDRDALRAWNTRADLFLFPSTFDTNGLVVREAAACGLASVLIKDSCAAEGITDGRNGFIIDENADAMAEILKKACHDLPHLHEVGQHAMDEIYLSWQTCVAEAYDRYAFILEEKQRGALPAKRPMPTDYMVRYAAHSMEEQAKLRQIRQDLFDDFKETAIGMMENVEEAKEQTEAFRQRVREHAQQRLQHLKEGAQEAGRRLGL